MKRDVIVEGAKDPSPMGRDLLARALANRYGYDVNAVGNALKTRRRIRVKAGLEELAAVKLKAELDALGAITVLTESAPRLGPLSGPIERLTLSTLDGEEPDTLTPPPPASFGPPMPAAGPAPASFGPPIPAAPPSPPPPTGPKGHDVFAPPDELQEEIQLVALPKRHGIMAEETQPDPEPAAPVSDSGSRRQTTGRSQVSSPSLRTVAVPTPPALPSSLRDRLGDLVRDPRGRFAAALAIGLVVGFIAAHVYGAGAEEKLDDIRMDLARQPPPTTEAEYTLSMQQFDIAEQHMKRVRLRIAAVAGVIWLLVGGGAVALFLRFAPED